MVASPRRRQPRRIRPWAVAALAAVVLGAAAWFERVPILQRVGTFLVADDAISRADAIVITVDGGAAGVLEAADLVHAGVAPRVALFADPPDAIDREFLKRGVPYENKAAIAIRQLSALGVAEVEQIPRTVNGTEWEGRVLPGWCAARGFHVVVVVTGADHARRVGRVLRRSVVDSQLRVLVRASRYSAFDPERWWRSRDDLRIGIVELEKLAVDFARHPLS